jgi:hypothetical protein
MPDVVAAPGTGAPAVENPFAAYGLNPDGSPVEKAKPAEPTAAALSAQLGDVSAKLAAAEARLSKLPENFEGMGEKFKVIDRVMKAFAGDGDVENVKQYEEVWRDIKGVAKRVAPGFAKAMQILEDDPNAIDKLTQGLDGMAIQRVVGLNEQAHSVVMDAAKQAGLVAGMSAGDIAEFVFPFEHSITAIINSNPQARQAFLSGNTQVVRDIFARLAKPHVAKRLREKAARLPGGFPKAPPRGGAQPGATGDARSPAGPNIHTPQGKAAFHKAAVTKWLDKAAARDE